MPYLECEKCGAENPEDVKYCMECGEILLESSENVKTKKNYVEIPGTMLTEEEVKRMSQSKRYQYKWYSNPYYVILVIFIIIFVLAIVINLILSA